MKQYNNLNKTILLLGTIAFLLFLLILKQYEVAIPTDWLTNLTKPREQTRTVNEISIKSILSQKDIETVSQFIKQSLKPDITPSILTFKFAEKGNAVKGDAYAALWTKNSKQLSILVGLDVANKTVAYQRIWVFDPSTTTTAQQATEKIATITSDAFQKQAGVISCGQDPALPPGTVGTLCAAISSVSDGSMNGVTTRFPAQPETTIVSFCRVSPAAAATYPHRFCI